MHAKPFFGVTVAIMTASPAHNRLDDIAYKWRLFVEKRRDHLVDMHMSGRWTTYYSEQKFKNCMRDAADAVERWSKVAPRPAPEAGPDVVGVSSGSRQRSAA